MRLMQMVGGLSCVFAVCHYPLMPASPAVVHASAAGLILWAVWIASVVCGLGCAWKPNLAILPAAYLVWSLKFSPLVTGLPSPGPLDVLPLTEITICLASGLALTRGARIGWFRAFRNGLKPNCERGASPLDDFAQLLVLLALAIHLGNYFWSFVAKMALNGPLFGWALHNDPGYLFLGAIQTGRIAFANHPWAVAAVFKFLARPARQIQFRRPLDSGGRPADPVLP